MDLPNYLNRIGLAALLLAATPVLAAETESAHYTRCLGLTASNPAAALADATSWAKTGGTPAGHCAAVALTGLRRYDEAATRLDALARAKSTPGGMRAALFDQAGNAWMLAGNGKRAVISLQAALTLAAGDPDFFADLARAEAMNKNWREVVLDLNAALNLHPSRSDLLMLRASAHRALKHYTDARKDINAALALKPGDADTLMERGLLKRDIGDLGGARTDFLAAQKAGSPALKREAAVAMEALN